MAVPKVRNRFSPRSPVKMSTEGDKIRVKQEFRDEVNINTIMKRVRSKGAILPNMDVSRKAFFGDVSAVGSFMDVHERMQAAKDGFMQIPSDIRSRFQNDPMVFLEFASNPENRDQMVEMGLLDAPAAPAPAPAPGGAGAPGAAANNPE